MHYPLGGRTELLQIINHDASRGSTTYHNEDKLLCKIPERSGGFSVKIPGRSGKHCNTGPAFDHYLLQD